MENKVDLKTVAEKAKFKSYDIKKKIVNAEVEGFDFEGNKKIIPINYHVEQIKHEIDANKVKIAKLQDDNQYLSSILIKFADIVKSEEAKANAAEEESKSEEADVEKEEKPIEDTEDVEESSTEESSTEDN